MSFFSLLSLIFCRPRTSAAPFSDFHGFHHLRCLRAWTSQRFSIDFEPPRQLSSDFETTLRLPSDFLRPTQALLKCFRSYWTFASSSRHAHGLALQLTPRSLNIAFSDASAGRVRSRRGCCINILGGKVGFRSSLFVHLSLLRLLRSTIDGVHRSSKVDKH